MSVVENALSADWLGVCRSIVAGIDAMLIEHPTTRERAVSTGRGMGGDDALMIDRAAEDVVFEQLDALSARGLRFTAISEERGEVGYGDRGVLVVIDPIDGSTNAKRGLTHHGVSIAVADGETMADVAFGFVYDFGAREEWSAWRGDGVRANGSPVASQPHERRSADGKLELVAIESADPRWIAETADDLVEVAHRVRALGSIAIALCQVACGRVDGFATLWRSRAVDAAAGQLIVRESQGLVAFTAYDDPLAAPLDLVPHSPLVAARTQAGLTEMARVPVF
jgi:myo-inositol-1(or 4)-monophosphatase